MFEKYNINELYLGSVRVTYADVVFAKDVEDDFGGILIFSDMDDYEYWTVLRKIDENTYIDLHDMKSVGTIRNSRRTSYTVSYMEPLNNYYMAAGKFKNIFSRRQAVNESNKYFESVKQSRDEMIEQEQQKTRKLSVR